MDNLERAKVFFRGALGMVGNGLEALWKVALAHKKASAIGAVVVIVVLIALPLLIPKKAIDDGGSETREVTLIRVGDIAGAEPLSLIGEVRSKREARVAPDSSGTVSAVYRTLGDAIGAGAIIAELKNETQKAAVAQARAALEKAKSGTAIGAIGVENAKNAFTASQQNAATTIASGYSVIEDAVARKADQMFSNPTGNQPKFNVVSSNSQLVYTVEAGRVAMGPILARHRSAVPPGNTDAALLELETLSAETDTVADFLGDIAGALAGAIATNGLTDADISAYRSDVNAALSAVNALRASLPSVTQDLKSKRAAIAVAEEGVAVGESGTSSDIAAAQANLAAAEAQLEKTIIRAPISGIVNSIDIEVGSFVNASVPVVFITNAAGLEVVAFLSGSEISNVVVGAKAIIGGLVEGVLVKKAQALDPLTKKAEIRIAVSSGAELVSGQSVTVAVERAVRKEGVSLSVPLSALKITPEGPRVFSVSSENLIVAHPVVLGALRGSTVEIKEGITAESVIVKDARGLKEGQEVIAGS